MKKLLRLLEKDAHLTAEELALMCEKEVGDIKKMIDAYEEEGIILGYTTVIDWDKTDTEYVNALIELKVIPERLHDYDARVFHFKAVFEN